MRGHPLPDSMFRGAELSYLSGDWIIVGVDAST